MSAGDGYFHHGKHDQGNPGPQARDDPGLRRGNRVVPVTVVAAGPVVVTAVRTPETDGYSAVQFAFGAIDPRKVTKPVAGHFAKAGVTPRRHIAELRTETSPTTGRAGTDRVEVFDAGELVDVTGTSKGKGYRGCDEAARIQGPGRRPRRARKHRSPGSIGGCSTPGRVFKGMRMAGRMGGEQVTTQNLTIHAIDAEKGLVLILGAVPGPKNGVVFIKSAVKNHSKVGA